MPWINLPYANKPLNTDDLIKHIRKSGRDYIIQGQQALSLKNHTKPNSLDYWLRDNYAQNPDTKQAVNKVIADLIKTGKFTAGKFRCPDTGWICKGLQIID